MRENLTASHINCSITMESYPVLAIILICFVGEVGKTRGRLVPK